MRHINLYGALTRHITIGFISVEKKHGNVKQLNSLGVRMEFLHGLKYILSTIGISQSKSLKVVGIRISTGFVKWFIGVSILMNIVLQFLLCIIFYQRYGIQSILVPSHFFFYFISMGFVFGSLLRNADMIFELFEFIEHIIRKSRQKYLQDS